MRSTFQSYRRYREWMENLEDMRREAEEQALQEKIAAMYADQTPEQRAEDEAALVRIEAQEQAQRNADLIAEQRRREQRNDPHSTFGT